MNESRIIRAYSSRKYGHYSFHIDWLRVADYANRCLQEGIDPEFYEVSFQAPFDACLHFLPPWDNINFKLDVFPRRVIHNSRGVWGVDLSIFFCGSSDPIFTHITLYESEGSIKFRRVQPNEISMK